METVQSKKVKSNRGKSNNKDNHYDSGKVWSELSTDGLEIAPIDILDNDCMEIIFSYLDMVDLIKIEAVSKKWKELSLKSWKNFKKVNTVNDFGRNFEIKHLGEILKRNGDYLTHLDLMVSREDSKNLELMSSIPLVINNYCKNLSHLGIITYQKNKKNWEKLENSVFKNLKSLFIENRYDGIKVEGKHMLESYILKNTVNLEKLHLDSFSFGKTNGTCLLHLTDKCTDLAVKNCTNLDRNIFKEVLKKIPRLERLDVTNTAISPEDFQSFSNQLKSLNVRELLPNCFLRNLHLLSTFQNLQDLDISFNGNVNDEILGILISRCSLVEKLNLTGCCKITDRGFLKLGNLRKLICLDISMTLLSNAALTRLVQTTNKLQEFQCMACRHITDTGLISVIKFCTELKLLTFDGNEVSKVNKLFFQSALKSVEMRSNKIPLTINIILLYLVDPWNFNMEITNTVKAEVKRFKLTKHNNRPSKYNVCRIKFSDVLSTKETLHKIESWYVTESLH